jgi:hypothetical protein
MDLLRLGEDSLSDQGWTERRETRSTGRPNRTASSSMRSTISQPSRDPGATSYKRSTSLSGREDSDFARQDDAPREIDLSPEE